MREWIVPVVAVALVAPLAIAQFRADVFARRERFHAAMRHAVRESMRREDRGRF